MSPRTRKLQEALAQRGDISGLAKQILGISRPTIYRYIDYYDNGSKEKIPTHIKAYFQAVLQPELFDVLNSYERCLHELRLIEFDLREKEDEYRSSGVSVSFLSKSGKPLNSYETINLPEEDVMNNLHAGEIDLDQARMNERRLMSKRELIRFLTKKGNDYRRLEEEAMEICSRILSTPRIQEWDGEHHPSVMYISKDKLMVILGDMDVKGLAVEIGIMLGEEDTVIGTFRPKDGCRYVTITDLVPGPDYSYAIVNQNDKAGVTKERIRFKLE